MTSGTSRGLSEFQTAQRDLQAMVKRLGHNKLPLNDDTLRPFLAHLWTFAEKRNVQISTFNIPRESHDQLYCGPVGDLVPIMAMAGALMQELYATFAPGEIVRARLTVAAGKTAALYFASVWTPMESLTRH